MISFPGFTSGRTLLAGMLWVTAGTLACSDGPAGPITELEPGTFRAEVRGLENEGSLTGRTIFFPANIRTEEGTWEAAALELENLAADGPECSILIFFPLGEGETRPATGQYQRDVFLDISRETPAPGEPVALIVAGRFFSLTNNLIRYEATRLEIDLRKSTDRELRGEFTLSLRPFGEPEGETFTAEGAFFWVRSGD